MIVAIISRIANRTPDVGSNNISDIDIQEDDPQAEFLRKIGDVLPYQGEGFYVDYPYYNIFTINYFSEEGKARAERWVEGIGIDKNLFEVKYISESMQKNSEDFIAKLPLEQDGYFIYFSIRTNKLVVEYDNNTALSKAKGLLAANNISEEQFIISYIPR